MRRSTLTSIPVLGLAAVWLYQSPAQNTSPADYLSPQLRAAVTQLKRDAAAAATTEITIVSRGKVLFDWINAYSLTGGPVPVNATQTLAPVYAFEAGERDLVPPQQLANLPRAIDDLVYEFTLKDEKPAALPRASFASRGPYAAASMQTIEQTITVGDMPFVTGALVVAARQLMADSGLVQNRDPKQPGYLSIRSSRAGVGWDATTAPLTGMHGGFRGSMGMPAFRLSQGRLEKGDTITLVYGDRSQGSPGWKMQNFANEAVMLPIYVDPEAKGRLLTLAWPSFAVHGNHAASLRLYAPSIVRTGERFELVLRAEDRVLNRAAGALPMLTITRNGAQFRSVVDAKPYMVMGGITIDAPGIYRYAATSRDGALQGESNPIWVQDNPETRIYWGETHAHTGMAEGQGTIEGFYKYGKEDAALDYLGLSEHDVWLDDFEWKQMQDAVKRYSDPGRFVAFLGYEWSAQRTSGGHHNVFFRSPTGSRVAVSKAWSLSRLYQGLRTIYNPRDVLIIPHAHQAGDWRRNDPDMERLVEIMSMHGTFEWFGNYYLKRGHEVGFLAGSDDHRTRPGLSGTMATGTLMQFGGLVGVRAGDKTAPSIFDALRARSTYAVSGADRILLDVRLNGTPSGQRTAHTRERRITARISGTSSIDRADVIKNGDVIFTRRFASAPLAPKVRTQISFESSSEPSFRDNPRGHRTWQGSLEVKQAKLAGFQIMHFENRLGEYARLDPSNPNRIQFSTATRGRADIIELDLEGASASTRIEFQLSASTEIGVSPPFVRPMNAFPATTLSVAFSELADSLIVKSLGPDSLSVQLVDPAAPKDRELEFVDRTATLPGDYYYVRISQRNGSRAWSSPAWAGGEPAR